ncbi:MAG: Eco29kI family restriction endonuclease [Sphingomonadaceae bacterium]
MNQKTLTAQVDELRESIAQIAVAADDPGLSQRKKRNLENQLRELAEELSDLISHLDPIAQPTSIFDPSNPKVVGRFVSLALVAQKRHPLQEIPRTYGSGVYAIYYTGEFPLYAPISRTETPIYVGQAAPNRRGAKTAREQGPKLSSRLHEHRKNIAKAVETLRLSDFEFRSLVVQSGWETAAEDYLIHLFDPVWNSQTSIVYGIGKHGDAATTRANKRSPWDTLHPGRKWAAESAEDAKTVQQIQGELQRHFNAHPPFQDLEQVLRSFLAELSQV